MGIPRSVRRLSCALRNHTNPWILIAFGCLNPIMTLFMCLVMGLAGFHADPLTGVAYLVWAGLFLPVLMVFYFVEPNP